MKRLVTTWLLLAGLAFFSIGCGGGDKDETGTNGDEPAASNTGGSGSTTSTFDESSGRAADGSDEDK